MSDWAWDFARTFISAGFGTAAMTAAISIWRDRGQRQSEATYLALRLAIAFERYTADCNDLITTNHNAWAPPGEELPDWTTKLPELSPYPADGDGWKALSANLAADCLNMPNRIRESQAVIADVVEYHEEGAGEAVESEACDCGLAAWELASQLRARYKIKAADPVFDYAGHLQRAKRKIESDRAAHAAKRLNVFAPEGPGLPASD